MQRRTGTLATLVAFAAAALTISASGVAGPDPTDAAATAQAPIPPGANDFSCDPPARHPQPVVLAHGTGGDRSNWSFMAPRFAAEGYCVFALNYGNFGRRAIPKSARELRAFVHRVLRATGASKVDIVGHSQGSMMPRYYAKFLGGNQDISDLVGLAPPNHGTTTPLAPIVGGTGECRACAQQVRGSRFMRRLNRGDDTPGPIDYTVVTTRYDEVVTPYTSGYLDGRPAEPDGPKVNNVLLQNRCPQEVVEHNQMAGDPVAYQWAENALGRDGPARESLRPDCPA